MDAVRLLVISHNCFSTRNNMGKTLAALFSRWPREQIAQLYFSSQTPDGAPCDRYFQITDFDVANALLGKRKCGGAVEADRPIREPSSFRRTILRYGKRRTAIGYWGRNLLWRWGWRDESALEKWLDDFAPEAVFFAAGDYAFSYEIAMGICARRNIPLYLYCCDDYYLGGFPAGGILGRREYRALMAIAERAMAMSAACFCISEEMAEAYSRRFSKEMRVLPTAPSAISEVEVPVRERRPRIIYAGNLDGGRADTLIRLGQALAALDDSRFRQIHVYSTETDERLLAPIRREPSLCFHGALSADALKAEVRSAAFVLHVEPFAQERIARCRYSVSTKIPDLLWSGGCLIAVGAPRLASVAYLSRHRAAFVIESEAVMTEKLGRILGDDRLQEQIVANARVLARKNHDPSAIGEQLMAIIRGREDL